jgi:acetoin utilization deacetylase AcuC-like enzyme
MKTGLLQDSRFLEHDTGEGHPENKERLIHTLAYLQKQNWFGQLSAIAPRKALIDDISLIHSHRYIERAQKACKGHETTLDTADVAISEKSFDIARLAAGGALELADQIMAKKIQNGFALLRPPGHHAEAEFAMGFCLFNNAAIAARYFQKKYGLERILILDWDVHHGNGTQHTFENDPSVLYASLHQYPYYPGTGAAWETGTGKGVGGTLNCPMKAGAGDMEYQEAFKTKIIPKIHDFKPDAIILSAGFDAHVRDPLGNICLSTNAYGWMTDRVMELADKYSNGRILSLLEGGYDLQALPECVAIHLLKLQQHSLA